MSFKQVIGQAKPVEQLRRAILHNKVVHSYLFLGNEGIGKRWLAIQFAKALNCPERTTGGGDACDRCLSCKKIEAGNHPDVSVIEPEGQTLKIDQVRQMQKDLAYRPYEGDRRVVILTTADRMAPNMSNALLKTLEEPPLHTVILLLAQSSRAILPTILSRCQQVRFDPLPSHTLSRWLMEEKGLEEEEAHLLASLSEGSPGKALDLREEIRQTERKGLLEEWLGTKSLSFGEMEAWVDSLPSDRRKLMLILELAKTLLRDMVVLKATGDVSKLIHTDLVQDMMRFSSERTLPSLFNRLERIHETILAISPLRGNANTALALEAMMLSWAEG